MTTTTLLVEILVIGCFASLTLFLVIIKLFDFDMLVILGLLERLKGWEATLTIVSLPAFYLLGWVTNLISFQISRGLYESKIRKRIFGPIGEDFVSIRVKVFSWSSGMLESQLLNLLSTVRLLRSSAILFTISAITFIFSEPLSAIIFFILSISFLFLSAEVFTRYSKLIHRSYLESIGLTHHPVPFVKKGAS